MRKGCDGVETHYGQVSIGTAATSPAVSSDASTVTVVPYRDAHRGRIRNPSP